jgi:hypothetical protein
MNPHFHDEFVALSALYHSGEISEEDALPGAARPPEGGPLLVHTA